MQVFKAARYFSPTTTGELKPVASDLDILHSLSFLTSGDITNLKTEIPLYLAAVEDISPIVDPTNGGKGIKKCFHTGRMLLEKSSSYSHLPQQRREFFQY